MPRACCYNAHNPWEPERCQAAEAPAFAGNPNHPVVLEMSEQWHKLAAMLLCYFRAQEGLIFEPDGSARVRQPSIDVTPEMIEFFTKMYPGGGIVADTRGGGLTLRLVTAAEGLELVRKEGGQAH